MAAMTWLHLEPSFCGSNETRGRPHEAPEHKMRFLPYDEQLEPEGAELGTAGTASALACSSNRDAARFLTFEKILRCYKTKTGFRVGGEKL